MSNADQNQSTDTLQLTTQAEVPAKMKWVRPTLEVIPAKDTQNSSIFSEFADLGMYS